MKPYYESERLTIYCGDTREIAPTLPKVDLVITDPPYAIGASKGEWSATAAVAIGLHEVAKRVHSKGSMIVFTTTSGRGIEFTQGAMCGRLPFNRLLIWSKSNGNSRAMSPWNWDSVSIMLFGRAPSERLGSSSIFTTPARYEKETKHPAELPDGISEWLYAPFDKEGMTVLDPFVGTGRLLESPLRRGCKVIGIEKEEKYAEIATNRLKGMLNGQAAPIPRP